MGMVDVALQLFQSIARPANQKSEAGKCQPVDEQRVQHARVNRSSSAHYRLWMLGPEEPNREVNERHAERAQNRKSSREQRRFSAGRKTAQKKITDVDEPENQSGGEAHVPRPPDAPDRTCTDGPGDQNDGTENHSDFIADEDDDIGGGTAFDQVGDGSYEIDEEEDECRPGGGHVIIEDALDVAHCLLGGRDYQCLVERVAKQDSGKYAEDGESFFHWMERRASSPGRTCIPYCAMVDG